MQSVERNEQESLGSIIDTMHERLESSNVTPTCIGILGPVGSGKKFAARSLSKTVGNKWPIRQRTENARGMRVEALVNACNAIRDNAAEDYLTIVSFENFEAQLESDSGLLDEFTSIMRYGMFRDAGHERTVSHLDGQYPSITSSHV